MDAGGPGRVRWERRGQADVYYVQRSKKFQFLACRVCGRSQADLHLARQSAGVFPSFGVCCDLTNNDQSARDGL